MLNIGLQDRKWPSKEHRVVAEIICLCNPSCNSAQIMKECIDAILKVPQDQIKDLSWKDLRDNYGLPI